MNGAQNGIVSDDIIVCRQDCPSLSVATLQQIYNKCTHTKIPQNEKDSLQQKTFKGNTLC